MSFKADYYEAMVWVALEELFPGAVKYEPDRSTLSKCALLCEFRDRCTKPIDLPRLVFTIPDFLVDGEAPRFYSVCYWDSKETSHAKFWRTISELVELKRFVPNAHCTVIVFEADFINQTFRAEGWYLDLLRVFVEVFDEAVFFNGDTLRSEAEDAQQVLSGNPGTSKIYSAFQAGSIASSLISGLKSKVLAPVRPVILNSGERQSLWRFERQHCALIQTPKFGNQIGLKLRNAMLQLVLISAIYEAFDDFNSLLETMSSWRRSQVGAVDYELASFWKSLPIEFRGGEFNFLISALVEEVDETSWVRWSDDLEWLLDLWDLNRLPISRVSFVVSLSRCREAFLASDQVLESVSVISGNGQALIPIDDLRRCTGDSLWRRFTSVPRGAEYNHIAERLIAATGLGTYPLVSAIRAAYPDLAPSRNDIRALYSNRVAVRQPEKQRAILLAIRGLISGGASLRVADMQYLLRKTKRIIGPQSAINPLAIILVDLLSRCVFAAGVELILESYDLRTLASDLCPGDIAGLWRLGMHFRAGSEIVPIFFSAMKSESNCSDKTREFCGHLDFAKYRLQAAEVSLSEVRRGVAVLEGAYGDDDKLAFAISGFAVCSIDTFVSTLVAMGLVVQALDVVVHPEVAAIGLSDAESQE